MEFLEKIFGSAENPQYGGIVSLLLGGGLGAYFGGGLGALLGTGLGAVLAPVVNEIVFGIRRETGTITPPPRDTTITAKTPLVELNTAVAKPDNSLATGSLSSPMLENMTPPPADAVATNMKKREDLWRSLLDRKGTGDDYAKAVKALRDEEKKADVFMATVDAYHGARDSSLATTGNRASLVNDVRESQKRKGIITPLTEDQIQRFVPTLPPMPKDKRERIEQLIGESIPAELVRADGTKMGFASAIRRKFIMVGDKEDPAKVAEWDGAAGKPGKSSLEKLNFALNTADDMRFRFEQAMNSPITIKEDGAEKKYESRWLFLAKGDAIKAEEIRKLPPEKMFEYADKRVSFVDRNLTDPYMVDTILNDMKTYANSLGVYNDVQKMVKGKMTEALAIYTEFQTKQLIPAEAAAKEFATKRLDIFNHTGIAIMNRGTLPKEKGPAGVECHTMTYIDTAAEGSVECTVVMQKDAASGKCFITHHFEGGMPATPDWKAAQLKQPVPVDECVFTQLSAPAGKLLPLALRDAADSVSQTPYLISALSPNLRRQFEGIVPEGDQKYVVSNTEGMPGLSSQSIDIQLKKLEKADKSTTVLQS